MTLPEEFKYFCRQLHADIGRFSPLEEDLKRTLSSIGKQRRDRIANFIDALTNGPYDAEELFRQWWNAGGDSGPGNAKQIPAHLALIRKLIDAPEVRNSKVP